MSYTEIMLVRHADATHMQTPDIVAGWAPYSVLTEQGVRQSQQLGEFWRSESYKPDAAYTSPIIRAINTLQIAQMTADMPVESYIMPELAEQCLGGHEGKQRESVYNPYTQRMIGLQGALYRHQGQNILGAQGEALLEVPHRMIRFMSEIHAEKSSAKLSVVAMSHRIAITGLVSYLELDGDKRAVDPFILLQNTMDRNRHDIRPCSETLVVVENGSSVDIPKFRVEYTGRPLPE